MVVQMGSVFPESWRCIFIVGVLLLSTTVRSQCCFNRFGVVLVSVEHVDPPSSAACYSCLPSACVFLKIYKNIMKQNNSTVGQCFPHTDAV
jgi:hypothetical protein